MGGVLGGVICFISHSEIAALALGARSCTEGSSSHLPAGPEGCRMGQNLGVHLYCGPPPSHPSPRATHYGAERVSGGVYTEEKGGWCRAPIVTL